MDTFDTAFERLLARIEELGEVTDTPRALTRTFLSPANLQAAQLVARWMEDAGMETQHDLGGTVRGVLASREAGVPAGEAAPLVMGSHLDTVIDAGKYDGALGVLVALAALEVTGGLPFPVHLLAFSDEEGVRFHATYLGSRACVGPLGPEILAVRDFEGISLEEALEREGWQADAVEFFYKPGDARGYVEVHIEQGRVLEELGEAVCGVSAICGQSRLKVTLTGQTDHAGTTPMELRKDALAGAAECVLAVERAARRNEGLLATVGKLETRPGVSNAIPGEVKFTLDFRHPEDRKGENLLGDLLEEFAGIAEERGLQVAWELVQGNAAVPCDEALSALLLDAAEAATGQRRVLPSGAGHDGVMMARAMPVAMLFVRCRAGLSHHPDEYASPEDIGVALRVLVDFLRKLEGKVC